MRTLRPLALASLAIAASCQSTDSSAGSHGRAGAASLEWSADDALLPLALDRRAGTAHLRLPPADERGVHARFLLVAGIETGLGANDVGLDRGQMSRARLVRFRSVGGRVLLEELNTGFRAEAGSDGERRAAAQSFATSVIWAGERGEPATDGSLVVDVTSLVVRDAHGIAGTLKSSGEGAYSLDEKRSAVDVDRCRAFPDNLEFAAVLTFTSTEPGRHARATAPDGRALTFVVRQGLLRLPDDGYSRRPFDPRMGAFAVSFLDYGVPLDAPLVQRLAVRHRLRVDPATGAPEPIVYYVDRAAPEPVRSALVEGASWWARAFAAAGYPGLFRVEVAPEDLDPLDVRHNVIQWVHRSTRGWSYGNAVRDPRTGEILKGHVSLGSLRVRQDRLLFEGLLGTAKTGTGDADDPVELALARIRQLSAHEVGHTLGLSHNFAASIADRASVMDYPAPRVRPGPNGSLDVSDAYGVGVGAWDVFAIRFLYEAVPDRSTTEAFYDRLTEEARSVGIVFLTDQDARSAGAAQPLANLWDEGADPVRGLVDALEVRRRALARFGRDNLAAGRPLAELEEVFVPLYLHHRYQVDGAVKRLGGVMYEHATNRPAESGARPVPADLQLEALTILGSTLRPDVLRIPDEVRSLLLPRPPGYGASRETFDRAAGAAFDWRGAADVAARMTVRGVLHPERLLRCELQRATGGPAFELVDTRGVMAALFDAVAIGTNARADAGARDGMDAALIDVARVVVVEEALRTYRSPATSRPVREALHDALAVFVADDAQGTLRALQHEVRSTLERPVTPEDRAPTSAAPDTPPGSPIGTGLPRDPWAACCSMGMDYSR